MNRVQRTALSAKGGDMSEQICKTRAVVYRRITGAKGGAESGTTQQQTEAINALAKELNVEIVTEFNDVGMSREGFSDLWGYINQYAPAFLLVPDFSHMYQDRDGLLKFMKVVAQRGTQVMTANKADKEAPKIYLEMDKFGRELINQVAKGPAKCIICDQQMFTGTGCKSAHISCDGKCWRRIPAVVESGSRCHDCCVTNGQYHHHDCDQEQCPACHRQLLSCDCDVSYETAQTLTTNRIMAIMKEYGENSIYFMDMYKGFEDERQNEPDSFRTTMEEWRPKFLNETGFREFMEYLKSEREKERKSKDCLTEVKILAILKEYGMRNIYFIKEYQKLIREKTANPAEFNRKIEKWCDQFVTEKSFRKILDNIMRDNLKR